MFQRTSKLIDGNFLFSAFNQKWWWVHSSFIFATSPASPVDISNRRSAVDSEVERRIYSFRLAPAIQRFDCFSDPCSFLFFGKRNKWGNSCKMCVKIWKIIFLCLFDILDPKEKKFVVQRLGGGPHRREYCRIHKNRKTFQLLIACTNPERFKFIGVSWYQREKIIFISFLAITLL